MSTYSFLDIVAALTGPGGDINLGNGAALGEEGITIEAATELNDMQIGADGDGMHSLIANRAATVTVRMLKTSPVNAQLQTMMNSQSRSSSLHGRNTITVRDVARGDYIALEKVAFKKQPTVEYGSKGAIMEWTFDAIRSNMILGEGSPEIGGA